MLQNKNDKTYDELYKYKYCRALDISVELKSVLIPNINRIEKYLVKVLSFIQVKLFVERMYGSQGSIKINYKTVSDSAVGNADYAQTENGAIQLDPQETQTSIFVTVKSINTIFFLQTGASLMLKTSLLQVFF